MFSKFKFLKFKKKSSKIKKASKAFNKLNCMITSVCETLLSLQETGGHKELISRLKVQKDTLLSVRFICFADKLYK